MFKIFSIETDDNQSYPIWSHWFQRFQQLGYETQRHIAQFDKLDDLQQDIETQLPDLILMDASLPQSFRICQTLKNLEKTETIPVIFFHTNQLPSGFLMTHPPHAADEMALVQCFESGATDYIHSEVGEDEILARIQAALRQKQAASHSFSLARQLSKMNTELYERNLQVERELYITRQLQQSLLPPFLPDEAVTTSPGDAPNEDSPSGERFHKRHYQDQRLKISGVYLPCDSLGGDLYDVIHFPDQTIGVSIADVSGHGVPAGFITAIFKSSFYRITHNYTLPSDILHGLNNELADIVKTGDYVTAFYCHIRIDEENEDQMILDYAGAGHPYPLHYQARTNQISRLEENSTPLIWIKNMEYPSGRTLLHSGDKVLLFTDGITEMRNHQNEIYGDDTLENVFLNLAQQQQALGQAQASSSTSVHMLDALIQQLSDYSNGYPLEDDLSAVLIEVL